VTAPLSRRAFLGASRGLAALGVPRASHVAPADEHVRAWWPQQDPATVQEVVGAAHADLARVKTLVERQPALANAAFDWGFGDWEDALGAAAHMGRRDIAEFLLSRGARPSLFAAAMLGQLDVVKAIVASNPGVQRTRGPHGIPLLAHARAGGGAAAAAVVAYLETLGDAGAPATSSSADAGERAAIAGRYRFGPGPTDFFEIAVRNGGLGIERPGKARRFLFPAGQALTYFPSGVPSVRIAFLRDGARVTGLTIADPDVYLRARRE
jgi:hypothetical protein